MDSRSGSVNLEWIRRFAGTLGIGAHAVSDAGALGFVARDPVAPRTYSLVRVDSTGEGGQPHETRRPGFTLESVHLAGGPPDATAAYLLTENDVYFVRQEGSLNRRSSLQARQGDLFLHLGVTGSDPSHSAIVLTADRAATSFTVSYLEADESGIRPLWGKTWGDSVLCAAISHDGAYVAVGQQNGNVILLNRQRRILWAYASVEESAVVAVAVDAQGDVIAYDAAGGIKKHESGDGSVAWRVAVPPIERPPRAGLPIAVACADAGSRFVMCGANTIDEHGHPHARYVYLDGASGDVIWDDKLDSGITGAAISPSGSYSAMSSFAGDILLLALSSRASRQNTARHARRKPAPVGDASDLLSQAQKAFNSRNFSKCVELLGDIFALDPSLTGSGGLYDDASWHLRESVMNETKAVSAQSLARVEAALDLLPYDEKLVIRRNALARILAEEIGQEAAACIAENRLEDAIAKYIEALSIDRSQTELRSGLRTVCDQLALNLIKQADTAFHEERYTEAIELLERVQELRPEEPAIVKRLEHAKGLRAYATGMRFYIQKRYGEAGFWFRKTLALLPDHAEAARYLGFAEKFGQQQSAAAAKGSGKKAAGVNSDALSERFGNLE